VYQGEKNSKYHLRNKVSTTQLVNKSKITPENRREYLHYHFRRKRAAKRAQPWGTGRPDTRTFGKRSLHGGSESLGTGPAGRLKIDSRHRMLRGKAPACLQPQTPSEFVR